jgi:putative chitobiose transport system permease protein
VCSVCDTRFKFQQGKASKSMNHYDNKQSKQSLRKKIKQTAVAYAFLLPAVIILGVFVFYPMYYGIVLGFYDYNMLRHNPDGTLASPQWVGLENFARVFRDQHFYISLKNSFLYLLIVPLIQFLAIILAVLVNRKMRGVTWFRTAYYIPVITSIVIVGIAWKWVFASDGILNFFLVKQLGFFSSPILWLSDRNIALFFRHVRYPVAGDRILHDALPCRTSGYSPRI